MAREIGNLSYDWFSKNLLSSSPTLKYKDYDSLFIRPSNFAEKNLYYITQIIDVHAKFPFYYKLDTFNSYCILYAQSGHSKLFYKDNIHILEPNSILFIDCNYSHNIELYDSEELHYQILYINGNNIDCFYKLFTENNHHICNLHLESDIPYTFRKLFQRCNENFKYSEFIISNLIASLLSSLLLSKEQNLRNIRTAPEYILEIKSLLDCNYAHSYTLDELAEQYNISKYKMVRDFTNYLSISPINYLINKRMEIAKNLLSTTSLSINEISFSVGIENTSHFINLFRKKADITPSNYRKLYGSSVICL
ncbi:MULTISPECIES: helix-turn-helix domain-containing protein [unclassified Clostridium]|uniref:helix-turn-helix domain-containing protein n=1 Tax=unclassified Clostridium TaxID=2614128 RepID=UPI000297DB67|nr:MULTISPECIES: helix-turn-helix domain-containing protein [unclassified Clostridium]EKQ56609.1 MAG: DNA-binding domain-containing protein, AraC-type [Clostridium sp. Maddingley MBC34-26]